tara:strand:- start:74 stop:481 length:408 start_codon:yes stop_codon:yes gene_type:complete
MSNVESNITQALNAQAEVMLAALAYPSLWAGNGGDQPALEHVTVSQLPNDNRPAGMSDQIYFRQGFLIITLVSPLGDYEIVTREKAGDIAAYFQRGKRLTANGTEVAIMGHNIRKGRQVGQRWETAIWIEYRSIS